VGRAGRGSPTGGASLRIALRDDETDTQEEEEEEEEEEEKEEGRWEDFVWGLGCLFLRSETCEAVED
jgi:ribosomal protein L12E/L44/L45/RPP1/RPP2